MKRHISPIDFEWVSIFSNPNKQWTSLFEKDEYLNNNELLPWKIDISNREVTEAVYSYFSKSTPVLLKRRDLNGAYKYIFNDDEFEESFGSCFEKFICGEEHDFSFDGLKVYDKPRKYCGKVFGVGDPTYNCKDCGLDPTCVFCHDCFHNSVHVNHRYKMHASQGSGGYCDCGDEEAWTSNPSCKLHESGFNVDDDWDPFKALPIKVQCRARFLFMLLLQYSVDMICWEEEDFLPCPLTVTEAPSAESYIVMLFNDESHTYDEVQKALKSAIKAEDTQAFHFAAIVDKDGRSSIFTNTKEKCNKVVQVCKNCLSANGKHPLKCTASHRDVIAHQVNALCILKWINTAVNKCSGLRRLLVLLSSNILCNRDETLVDQVVQMDAEFWKAARVQTHQVFMNALMIDALGREEFSCSFAKNYQKIVSDFIEDDHDHGISVGTMSVQIFTVPSISRKLILEYSILEVCFNTFIDHIKPAVGGNGHLDFNTSRVDLRRISYVLYDIRYLLRNKLTIDDELYPQFLKSFKRFQQILLCMQGMDSVKRKADVHIEYEPLWERGFDLQIRLTEVLGLLQYWCISNVTLLQEVLYLLLQALYSCNEDLPIKVVNDQSICIYEIKSQPVSVHYALSRFIAALIPALSKYGLDLQNSLLLHKKQQMKHKQLLALMEYPLRAIVLAAQVNGQMWKRNGYAILNQVWWYQSHQCTSEMRDRDILLLQVVASVMEPKAFFTSLLHKFELTDYFKYKIKHNLTTAEKQAHFVATEFLLTLYHIFNERHICGVGMVTNKDIILRELIHRLSLGPTPRSSLLKKIPAPQTCSEIDQSVEKQIGDYLKTVANYKEPGVTGKGLYELKKEYHLKCDPFFLHFTKTERSKMQEERRKILSSSELEKNFVANIPAFEKNFEGILKLLWSKELIVTLSELFEKALDDTSGYSVFVIEQIELALLILGIAFVEIERHKDTSEMVHAYTKMAQRIHRGIKGKPSLYAMIRKLTMKKDEIFYPYSVSIFKLITKVLCQIGIENMEVDDSVSKESHDNQSHAENEKQRKQQLAKEHRAKMMAQMNKMQNDFMNKNKGFFTETDSVTSPGTSMEVDKESDDLFKIAIGMHQSRPEVPTRDFLCILCQEKEDSQDDNRFIMTCFLQTSRIFVYNEDESDRETADDCFEAFKPTVFRKNNLHVSSCGHVAHFKCWEKHYESVKVKETFGSFPLRHSSHLDIKDSEYLCPLCKTLCNSVLPLMPGTVQEQRSLNISAENLLESTNIVEYLQQLLPKDSLLVGSNRELFETQNSQQRTSSSIRTALMQTQSSLEQATRLFHYYIGSLSEQSEIMELFLQKVYNIAKLTSTPSDAKAFEVGLPVAWISCSFTIQSLECYHRELNKAFFNEISDRQITFFNALISYLSASVQSNNKAIKPFAQVLLSFLTSDQRMNISILQIDPFSLLVGLRFLLTMLSKSNHSASYEEIPAKIIDYATFLLCLRVALVKIYLSAPSFERDISDDFGELNDADVIACINAIQSWIFVRKATQCYGEIEGNIDGIKLKAYIIDSLYPFLRCSALFFSVLNNVPLPEELKVPFSDELGLLLKYLGLPVNVDYILNPSFLDKESYIQGWCTIPDVQKALKINKGVTIKPQSKRLYQLPQNYADLVNIVSNFKCPTVEDNSQSPCICLLCGKIICGQCFCCSSKLKVGSCTKHLEECCENVGIFIRVRDCEVVLLHKGQKGTILQSPYLDEHGEPDKGLMRGNPLFLNKQRFENLEQIWLKHDIPTTVSQSMESNRSMLAFDWWDF